MRNLLKSKLWLVVAGAFLGIVVTAKIITFNEEEALAEDFPIGSFEVQVFFEQQNVM
ncbi:hypothetical protein [Vibrio mexicanus]|uniref:hypothetical protein n=1 Tax=Vibrio mexicanus TaxID=1004326 RepID=UPI000A5F8613|nr:hypothetical protein [Vibrio mexicanus]